MTWRIGIITVKGPDYHPSQRLTEAGRSRGAEVVLINPYDCALTHRNGRSGMLPEEIVEGLDAVIPRQGAEIKTASLAVIAHFEQMGLCVINNLAAITKVRNKYFAYQTLAAAGLDMPETVYATSLATCQLARQRFAPLASVVKPISGRQGTGVHRLDDRIALPADIIAELEAKRGVLVQAYIEPFKRRDLRILVVGGQIVGAVSLEPPQGDFRANVHIGGKASPIDLPDRWARAACRAVEALGLDIAGVDIMIPADGDPMVVEVNYSPGFRGLETATGIDVAGRMMDYVLTVVQKRSIAAGRSPSEARQ